MARHTARLAGAAHVSEAESIRDRSVGHSFQISARCAADVFTWIVPFPENRGAVTDISGVPSPQLDGLQRVEGDALFHLRLALQTS